ncbi:MAG TPA: branched-chain amino acid ABC transporter substrate-binding protein [Stellaceae bacterium]|nr:branched-chain amino acid ABC transporter substrate-binding protein [Stellaceae bacterium]
MSNRTRLYGRAVVGAFAAGLFMMSAAQAVTKGPVTDEIGVVMIPKGAPIVLGGYWVLSGADQALGIDQKRGVELAIKHHGSSFLGHPLKLIAEDSGCNAEGGQTAATKLASHPEMVAVVGPACSSEATPGAPILWKAGMINVCTSCTAPSLTAPDRKPEYAGFLRTIYSDSDQGRYDAKYAYEVLKAKTVVTIHDGSPFAQQLAAVMGKNFTALGGKVLSEEAVAPTDVDMHPVLTRIATEHPDVIYFPVFVAAGAQILRQGKTTPGLEKTTLLGGSGLMAADFIEAAKEAAVGFDFTYPDVSADAQGKGYTAFVEKYTKAYGEGPVSGFHSNAYDAATLVFMAIQKVAVKDSKGDLYIGRKALRDAAFAVKFDGISGPIACDPYGECAQFKPAVYQFTNADPKSFKIGVNPKKIWP